MVLQYVDAWSLITFVNLTDTEFIYYLEILYVQVYKVKVSNYIVKGTEILYCQQWSEVSGDRKQFDAIISTYPFCVKYNCYICNNIKGFLYIFSSYVYIIFIKLTEFLFFILMNINTMTWHKCLVKRLGKNGNGQQSGFVHNIKARLFLYLRLF